MNRNMKRLMGAALISAACFGGTTYWYKTSDNNETFNAGKKPVAFVSHTKDEIHRRPVTRIIWQLISEGDPVFPGEAIRTSSQGEARIQFVNADRFIDLEPDSLIVISQSQKNEISLDLMDGGLMVNQGSTNAAGGPALTLNSGKMKLDLSQATASLSKSESGQIDLQVLKGKAKVEGEGHSREIESGKSGALDANGLKFDSAQLQILSPSLEKAFAINPVNIRPVTFAWKGFPAGSLVSLELGRSRKSLKHQTETTAEKMDLKLSAGKYFWKLVAKDPKTHAEVADSPVYRLEVAARLPAALLSPEDEQAFVNGKEPSLIEFQWRKPERTEAVTLEIFKDKDLKEKFMSQKFSEEESFERTFPVGKYYARTSVDYSDMDRPVHSSVLSFEVANKPPVTHVPVGWINPDDKTPQYFIDQPVADLSWDSPQKEDVASWRLKLADQVEGLKDPQAQTLETKDLHAKQNLVKPGRYIAMVEALDEDHKVIGASPVKTIDVQPMPLLKAPRFNPGKGPLKADNRGRLNLAWDLIEGAKAYKVTLYKDGEEIRNGQFDHNSTELEDLMPGKYQIEVVAIDQYGRESLKEPQRAVQVPDTSGLGVPKVRKIKVK